MTESCRPVPIHGVTQEQVSPVAGNGPPLGVQGSVQTRLPVSLNFPVPARSDAHSSVYKDSHASQHSQRVLKGNSSRLLSTRRSTKVKVEA